MPPKHAGETFRKELEAAVAERGVIALSCILIDGIPVPIEAETGRILRLVREVTLHVDVASPLTMTIVVGCPETKEVANDPPRQ